MADPFVAEIRMYGFNFPPKGWAFCDGQLLPLSQNTALFSLLGTFYGGDGKTNFALPNLQGSGPMAPGQAQGGSLYDLGQNGGEQSVTLIQSEIPSHIHQVMAAAQLGTTAVPSPSVGPSRSRGVNLYQQNTSQNIVQMSPSSLAPAGGSQPHNNMMPYLTLNFCIALQGVFPARP
jgi:microcystin-dependent protein